MSKLATASNEMLKENSAPACEVKSPEPADHEASLGDNLRDLAIMRGFGKSGHARLRVLHVIDRLGMGGTEVGILKVIKGLSGEGFEHRICTIRGFDEEFAKAHEFEGRIYVAGRPGSGFQFLVGRLARIMRDFQPDIVHSRNWGAIEALLASRISGVPVAIHSEHGYEVDMLNGLPPRRRVFRRFAYAAADAVFTVTEELRSYHARQAWLPVERIRVLQNGVDTSRFARRSGEREASRRQLGFDESNIVFGAVGRLVPIKDQGSLLRAAEILIGKGLPVYVLLVGSGPELPKLKEIVAASRFLSGRVVFEGATADVPSSLNAMDVFVLPSVSEGMSNTLLEAMASGLPVVATRVGGNPELVEDERSGILFKPGDVTGLSAILERLVCTPRLREELGQEARTRTVQEFSLESMTGRYRDLYLELARKRGVLTAHQG
ncbi:MAG TPA: glycosyltransferase [Candidatus Acidoferrum sp.]|jgi:sugar transferase (PEP-CTERM/EpsH1 system associated)